jgi:hypothetical protein
MTPRSSNEPFRITPASAATEYSQGREQSKLLFGNASGTQSFFIIIHYRDEHPFLPGTVVLTSVYRFICEQRAITDAIYFSIFGL